MTEFLAIALLFARPSPAPGADALWSRGLRAEAIAAARAELGASPEPGAWTRIVGWQLAVHRYESALADAVRCGRPCDRQRGEALYNLGDYARAVELLDERDPTELLWKIDALEALSRFAESDAVLARARATVSNGDPRLLAAQGRSHARNGDVAAAAQSFRTALTIDPHDGEALFGLGRALVQSGRRAEGLSVLERHRRITPLLDAVEFARRGVDLAPAHAPNWTSLADAERELGRGDRARAAYARAAELATQAGEIVANALRWARLLADDEGDAQGAVDLLARTAERAPDARLHVRAGDVLAAARRPAEAVAAYERALALRPQDAEIARRIETVRGKVAR